MGTDRRTPAERHQYYLAHRGEIREKQRSYYRQHRDRLLAKHRERYRRGRKQHAAGRRAKREIDPDYYRRKHLRHRYRLSPADYETAVRWQRGRCAVCGRTRRLMVDHPQGLRIVRGLLCNACNVLLGFADEDCRILRQAIKYLTNWETLMPVKRATKDGKPGYRYGKTGKVYTYAPGDKASRARALQKAVDQALAIQRRTGKPSHL